MAITYSYEQGRWVSDDPSDPPFDPQTGSTTQPSDGATQDPSKDPPTTTTTTPPKGEDFSAFLTGLQNKYNVPYTANDSPIDLARLQEYQAGIDRFRALQADPNTDWEKESAKGAISFPSQLEDFKKALEKQYEQRGKNTDGPDDGTSSSGYVPPNTSGGGGGGGSTSSAGNYAMSFGGPPAPFSETYTPLARPDYLQGEYQAPARPAYLQGEYTPPPRPDYLQGPYVPPTFGETYTTPTRPDYLQGEYQAPTWTEKFQAPSVTDLQNEPGYLARLDAAQRGFERSAAAKGSVLSGGFVGRTLPRELQTQASNEYANVYGRAYDSYQQRYGAFQDMANRDASARAFNEGAYGADVANSLSAYNTRYSAFGDMANRDAAARQFNENAYGSDVTNAYNARQTNESAYGADVASSLAARGVNESAYGTDVSNNLNRYSKNYQAYLDLIGNTRNAENDWWARQTDIAKYGLDASIAGRPTQLV
jgi:hypothetical protein